MKAPRGSRLFLPIALAGVLVATPVALVRIRGLRVVSGSPSTNIVFGASKVVTSWSSVSEHPLRSKEIEAGERINEEQMRQRRERWERSLRSREQGK